MNFSNLASPTNLINSTSGLVLAGGSLSVIANPSGSTSQTFSGTTLNAGAAGIGVNSNGGGGVTLALGAIARSVGGTVNFTLPTTGSVTTSTANASGTILGGWATVGGTNWAVTGSSGTNPVTAFSGYQNDSFSSGNDVNETTSDSPASALSINSLRFNTYSTTTNSLSGFNGTQLALLGAKSTIASGGILVTPAVGTSDVVITPNASGGPTLTSGNAQNDLIFNQNNVNGALVVVATIANNGANATAVTKTGPGTVFLPIPNAGEQGGIPPFQSANSYTGGVCINQGILGVVTGTALGANPATPVVDITFTGNGTLQLDGAGSFGFISGNTNSPNRDDVHRCRPPRGRSTPMGKRFPVIKARLAAPADWPSSTAAA